MLATIRSMAARFVAPPAEKTADTLATALGASVQTPTANTYTLLDAYGQSPVLRAVVGKIAVGIAAVEWTAYARLPNGDRNPLPDHLVMKMLRAAPEGMTASQLIEFEQLSLMLVGDAFSILERDGLGTPTRRWPIPAHWVTRVPSPTEKWFEVRSKAAPIRVATDDMLWQKVIDPKDPYGRGRGIGMGLYDEITADEAASQHVAATLRNRAMPDAIISGSKEAPLNDVSVARLKAVWNERFLGPKRSGRPMFTSVPVTVESLTPSFKELDLANLRSFERDMLITGFGFPPEMIGVLSNSNRATIEAAELFFTKHVVLPRLRARRDFLNAVVAPMFDERLELDFDSPVAEDREFKRQVYAQRGDAFTLDEHRALAGDAPLDNGAGETYPTGFSTTYAQHAPPADDDSAASGGNVQATALNGAQIAALQAIIADVVDGTLPAATAVQLILVGFPTIDEDTARAMVNPAASHTPPVVDPKGASSITKDMAADVIRAVNAIDDTLMADMMTSVLGEATATFAQAELDALGVEISFDLFDARIQASLAETATARSRLIGSTTRKQLKAELSTGVAAGESTEKLVKRIQGVMADASERRAKMIARTEIVRTSNEAATEAHRMAGVTEREWLATQDGVVRDEHAALDGDRAGIDTPFSVDGYSGMFPGDFGDPGMDINCRCTTVPVFEGLKGEARAARWKSFDAERRPFEQLMERRTAAVFREQAEAAIKALRG